jgi:D-glycero-D-manno-heptose 1,7-bisphosphate phosphatase
VDRDGTINAAAAEHQYIASARDFRWLPGAVDGLVALARAGFVVTVVSNQRGVARGLVTIQTLTEIENLIQQRLSEHACHISAFRYCVHDVQAQCECRKPAPGMLLDLASTLGLDLSRSWMIGDSDTDVGAGLAAGCHTALLRATGGGGEADIVTGSLREAAMLIGTPAGDG